MVFLGAVTYVPLGRLGQKSPIALLRVTGLKITRLFVSAWTPWGVWMFAEYVHWKIIVGTAVRRSV